MDLSLSLPDRGAIFDAARHAAGEFQWLVRPDEHQEQQVQAAAAVLADASGATPLLAAARGFYAWIDAGGARQPIRAALIGFWQRSGILHAPIPLTGAAAMRADVPWTQAAWPVVFLQALAQEAEDGLRLLGALERAWFTARRQAASSRRSTSRAAIAINVLAAAPVVSATSLGQVIGIATKNAARLLDQLHADGTVIEVTHRFKRRLFGLAALAPLREAVAPPRRPAPGRKRGRPRLQPIEDAEIPDLPATLPPLTPIERRAFDYTDLNTSMALVDEAIRNLRRVLATSS